MDNISNRLAKEDRIPDILKLTGDKLCTFGTIYYPSCIYFLIENNEVTYIGKSENLLSRTASHIRDAEKGFFERVLYIPVLSDNLDLVEVSLIKYLKPPLNTKGTKGLNPITKQEKDIAEAILDDTNSLNSLL